MSNGCPALPDIPMLEKKNAAPYQDNAFLFCKTAFVC